MAATLEETQTFRRLLSAVISLVLQHAGALLSHLPEAAAQAQRKVTCASSPLLCPQLRSAPRTPWGVFHSPSSPFSPPLTPKLLYPLLAASQTALTPPSRWPESR